MSRVTWDQEDRIYEDGLDRGVLYLANGSVVPWSGLISVAENSSGGESRQYFAEGVRFLQVVSSEDYEGAIEAFTYPDELDDILDNQPRASLNLSYRTVSGSSFKLHLVYNALIVPAAKSYRSTDANSDPSTFSWNITTTPVEIPGLKPTAHLVIDVSLAYPELISALEDMLYGTPITTGSFPSVDTLLDLFDQYAYLQIIDHGDGTWTAIGPDEAIQMLDATSFEITWPSAVYLDSETYQISTF